MPTLDDLQQATGGSLQAAIEATCAPLGRVVTDSRQITPGDVFWALAGPNHDGADFAPEAIARGARGVVSARPLPVPKDRWLLCVDHGLGALASWARWHRDRFRGTVIAVTGSVGKTTTRQMIHTVLGSRFHGTASPHNFNNHVGVPLSMLQMEPDHDYAVLELAASRAGQIAALAELCRPSLGVVTHVGDAHLGGFGSRQAIADAKAELLQALPEEGHAILGEDPWLRRLARRCRTGITVVGRGAQCGLVAEAIQCGGGMLRFRVGQTPFRVPVWGRHHLTAALSAVAVGRRFGLEWKTIARALADFNPVPMRCQVTEVRGATIINDAYNASPMAMTAALELLRDFDARGRRIVVCGDMNELGEEASELHRRLGDQMVSLCGADLLFACGQHAPYVVAGARAAGMPAARSILCAAAEDALPRLAQTVIPGDVVLVKGSRTLEMERIVEALRTYPRGQRGYQRRKSA